MLTCLHFVDLQNKERQPGLLAATGSRDKTIRLWDTRSGACIKTLSGHDNWVRGLVFAPNGKFLLSVSDDKTMKVWDLASGRVTRTIEAHNHFITTIAWGRARVEGASSDAAPDARNGNGTLNGSSTDTRKTVNVVATGSVDLTVKLWMP